MQSLLFEDHVFRIHENQERAREVLGEPGSNNWYLDWATRTLRFSHRRDGALIAELPAQMVGSYSSRSDTWLWSWANKLSNLTPEIYRNAAMVRDLAEQEMPGTFLTAAGTFHPPSPAFAYMVSVLCAGFGDAFGFYRCPHETGETWVVIESFPEATALPPDPSRMVRAIKTSISSYVFDHELAAEVYLGEPDADGAYHPSGIRIALDDDGRIVDIQTASDASPAEPILHRIA